MDSIWMSEEHTELVQIAAVAAASVEALRFGTTGFMIPTGAIDGELFQGYWAVTKVEEERLRQDEKWGVGRVHTRLEYAAILAEEVGEWARVLLGDAEGVEKEFFELTSKERLHIREMLDLLERAEVHAREFIRVHDWDERQQTVLDAEEE